MRYQGLVITAYVREGIQQYVLLMQCGFRILVQMMAYGLRLAVLADRQQAFIITLHSGTALHIRMVFLPLK